MNEENTLILPPEEQAEQNDRDTRAEELENTFSYDGYQVVRKELFAHLRDPAIVIRKGQHHIQHGLHYWSGRCGLCSCHVQQWLEENCRARL